MEDYKRTHPWLTFVANLKAIPWTLWALLGECQSKCEHVRDAPILPDSYRELSRIYLIRGVVATVAIEGNTISMDEALDCWEGKSSLPPTREYQGREIKNFRMIHDKLLNIFQAGEKPKISLKIIKELNKDVLNGLILEDHVQPGQITLRQVGVSRYRGAKPEECEYLLERLCNWLNETGFQPPDPSMTFIFGIIKAVIAHLYIVWIHPFGDGNGRTARLVELIILMSSGIPDLSAHLLSDHYNRTRDDYYEELTKSTATNGDIIPFMAYAVTGLLRGLQDQVRVIQKQQWMVVWQGYVYRNIKGKPGPIKERKLRFVLAVSEHDQAIPVNSLEKMSDIWEIYHDQAKNAIKNDVTALVSDGLLLREKGTIRANLNALSAFRSIALGS